MKVLIGLICTSTLVLFSSLGLAAAKPVAFSTSEVVQGFDSSRKPASNACFPTGKADLIQALKIKDFAVCSGPETDAIKSVLLKLEKNYSNEVIKATESDPYLENAVGLTGNVAYLALVRTVITQVNTQHPKSVL